MSIGASPTPPPRFAYLATDDAEGDGDGVVEALTAIGFVVRWASAPWEPGMPRPSLAVIDADVRAPHDPVDVARAATARWDLPVLFLFSERAPDCTSLAEHAAIALACKPLRVHVLREIVVLLDTQHAMRARRVANLMHYHALFAHAAVGIAKLDAHTARVVDINPRGAAVFGMSTENALGADLAEWVEVASRQQLRDDLVRALDVSRIAPRELTGTRADGQPVWFRLTAAPLGPASPGHLVAMLEDVSERRRVEAALAQQAQANRAKTDFLAHMSHELRTPLNAVLGLTEALVDHTFGALNAEQANAIATIHDSGRHLLHLINDVLDIARIDSGKLAIDVQQISLRPLIEECVALVHSQLAAKAQRLVAEVAPVLPPVDIDKRRIKQVVLNLLVNAGKFSPPGATVTIRATAHHAAREVEIAVLDDGPGIAASDRARIFEPFVTLDPSLTRSQDGAGLGLALCKRIVEMHRGRIDVTSEVGIGTTFTVRLPVSGAYVAEPHITPRVMPAPAPMTRQETLLLAEDNAPTIHAVRSYLVAQGFSVVVAKSGPVALDVAKRPDIAAVLLDVQLPGMDGLEVLRRVRASGVTKPIISLTAQAMPDDEQRCLAAGATAYLAKPVGLRRLVELLDQLLPASR